MAQVKQQENNTNKKLLAVGIGGGILLALYRAFNKRNPAQPAPQPEPKPEPAPAPVVEREQKANTTQRLAVSKYSTVLYKEHDTFFGADIFKKEIIRLPSGTLLGLVREYTDDMVLLSYTINYGGADTTYDFYAKREHVEFVLRRGTASFWGQARLKEFINRWINL